MEEETLRINDLQCRGYRIYQNPNGYCFTSDSVILANLAEINKNDRVVDLCTGSGVVALLVAAKYSPKQIFGVEIQQNLFDMAKKSIELNGEEKRISLFNAPLQNIHKELGGNFDAVTVNPPYEPISEKKEEVTEEDICKTEITLTLEEVIKESSKLLKFGGLFFMVHRVRRLAEAIYHMKTNGIEPKKIYMVYPKKNKPADTFIIKGKKGGKPSLEIPSPIIVYDENGEYTPEVMRLYNK